MTEELVAYTDQVAARLRAECGENVTPNIVARREGRKLATVKELYKRWWCKPAGKRTRCTMPVERYAALRTGLLK